MLVAQMEMKACLMAVWKGCARVVWSAASKAAH